MDTLKSPPAAQQDAPFPRIFPRPETALAQVIGDPTYREAFHRRLQASNRFVVALYRIGLLPLLGAGRTTMLLTTRGRKSQRLRRFPVGYFRIDGEIYLISGWGKRANWYKNLHSSPDEVWLQIGFRSFPATATIIDDPEQVRQKIEHLISESPAVAKHLLGWDPDHDTLASADFSPLIDSVLFVRFSRRYPSDHTLSEPVGDFEGQS
jgi:deazaflavin-dependent oxidoreductase (nitroreductase family)